MSFQIAQLERRALFWQNNARLCTVYIDFRDMCDRGKHEARELETDQL